MGGGARRSGRRKKSEGAGGCFAGEAVESEVTAPAPSFHTQTLTHAHSIWPGQRMLHRLLHFLGDKVLLLNGDKVPIVAL